MNAPALADLTVEAERELLAILGEHFTAKQSETFAESSYRGGFRLVLADGQRSVEVLYSDMQLESKRPVWAA